MKSNRLPKTVEEAVDQIIDDLSLEERVRITRLSENELAPVKLAMVDYVQKRLKESGINEDLRKSCCAIAGKVLD